MTPARLTDERFHAAVETLRVPAMGTEVVAPLLANLVKLVRPHRVLEVGMGYTTPWLAAALAEAADDARAQAPALAAKTSGYLDRGADLDDEWMYAEPALLAPEFFTAPYQPRMVAVDDWSVPESSSPRVLDVLRALGLDEVVTVVNADLRECAQHFPADFTPIDFAWVDAWECLYFFDNFWDLVDPDGGIVVMHYLMTYPEGEAMLRYLARLHEGNPGEFETVNLLEPHKLSQNSLTILRRTSGAVRRAYAKPGARMDYGATLREQAERQAAAHVNTGRGTR
ncbi:class I SAM-dependent methyltransferase [Actinokineospora sp. G85]|uniref:class I SAM-dependent methyltransferase n=1 Tax=Actinokineospora sp. G85 TaxID=3406626 RepID=UPI003C73F481